MSDVVRATLALLTVACLIAPLRNLLAGSHQASVGERSSRERTIPTSAGLVLVPVVSLFSLPISESQRIFAAALALCLVGGTDDALDVPILLRLGLQIVAVILGLYSLELLPPAGGLRVLWIRPVLVGFMWLTFLNFFNFMDGIDGLAGLELVVVCGGLILLAAAGDRAAGAEESRLLWVLLGGTLGFLAWNFPSARIFLGDAGSIPLGFLLGWVLILASLRGLAVEALILSSYFFIDAGLTLTRRIVRGEAFWRPHQEHFYQRAVQAGRSHREVLARVTLANAILAGIAVAHATAGLPAGAAIAAGVAVNVCLLWWMSLR